MYLAAYRCRLIFIIRERLWFYPKTFGTKTAIADSIFEQYIRGRYPQFQNKRIKENFDWDETMIDYINGDRQKLKRSWNEVDEVYYAMNIKGAHWILIEISFTSWMLTAYDSDIATTSQAEFEKAMTPMAKMLPYLLLKGGLFESRPDLQLQLQEFSVRRLLANEVPQSKKR